ncbi:hypothetical protein [Cytobacillus horneckiae]|uniref:hypothetical protein n=1 Tax=Cytobacillus horneckiae TaxID=549687 RepID=UPI00203EE525|nr:hypothetical protein [Cytobacillus horneckiae]MCM3179738.1 hypothetical protein [Cytobacillus horneckiae]
MNWDDIKREWETTKITLKALAEKHDIKIGTLKSRKSREGWSRDATKKDATKVKKVATKKKAQSQSNRSGNPNPANQFTKRNRAAVKHGLRAKYFSDSQLEIMNDFKDTTIADQLWIQIEIKFSAIIQMQKVMWVEDAEDHLKENVGSSWGDAGGSESSRVAFAFERFESYVKAQTRAMAEYRNLVKHFMNLAHEDDERRMKLNLMQLNIDKTKAEIDKLQNNEDESDAIDDWIAAMGEVDG